MKSLSLILTLVLTLSLASCANRSSEDTSAQGVVDGTIVTVTAQVTGTLALEVEEGQSISAGQAIARIDARKIETRLGALKTENADLESRRRRLEHNLELTRRQARYFRQQEQRFSHLVAQGSLPRERLEAIGLQRLEADTRTHDLQEQLTQVALGVEKLKTEQDLLLLQKEDHTLGASCAGTVLEKHVENGEAVFPGSPVVDLITDAPLTVDVYLESAELSQCPVGTQAQVAVDGQDKALTARVIRVGQEAEFSSKYIISERERQSLLYRVTLQLEPHPGLHIGQPVTVTFPTGA